MDIILYSTGYKILDAEQLKTNRAKKKSDQNTYFKAMARGKNIIRCF